MPQKILPEHTAHESYDCPAAVIRELEAFILYQSYILLRSRENCTAFGIHCNTVVSKMFSYEYRDKAGRERRILRNLLIAFFFFF